MCDDYNPDKDIKLYPASELESMLRRIGEIEGKEKRTSLLLSFPPFERFEIEEELSTRK